MAIQESSFDALYDRHYLEILHYCFRRMRNRQDAEWLANETFIRAHLNWKKFDPTKGSFRTWIFTIAKHCCIDFSHGRVFRDRSRLETYDEDPLQDQDIHPKPKLPASEINLDKQMALWIIEECMKNLNERDAEIIELYYYHGLTLEEIARLFDHKAPNWTKKQLKRIEALLKQCFEKRGLDAPLLA